MDGHRTAGEDAKRLVADLPAVAVGTVDHVAAPAFAQTGYVRQLVDEARCDQQTPSRKNATVLERHAEAGCCTRCGANAALQHLSAIAADLGLADLQQGARVRSVT